MKIVVVADKIKQRHILQKPVVALGLKAK